MTPTVDLTAGALNVRTTQGDDVAVPLQFTEAVAVPNLTGRTYLAQLRKKATSDEFTAVTVDVSGAATGLLVLRLAKTVTAGLSGKYAWDLEQTIGGVARTILGGEWEFAAQVARTP